MGSSEPIPTPTPITTGENENEFTSIFYPTTWPLDQIEPKLHIYKRNRDELIITHQIEPKDCIHLLNTNNYITKNITKVIFLTHGFRNTIESEWLTEMKDALLDESMDDLLVIIISWGKGSDLLPIYYLQAAANIQTVGDWLAPFAKELANVNPGIKQHAIGHSLGAHLIGLAGKKSGTFNRISALDPAGNDDGPGFERGEFLAFRLASTDAEMVDVIHTDGWHSKLYPSDWFAPVNHYGTLIPLGTVDYYPNYGYAQPGAGEFEIAGSHTRAYEYFIWSITNPGKFETSLVLDGIPSFENPITKTVDVEIKAEMGYYANNAANSGLYYIGTNKTVPWIGDKPLKDTYCAIS